MRALLDTNVVLDVLLERRPFTGTSSEVLACAERGEFDGLLASTTVTTIYYIGRRRLGSAGAKRRISELLAFLDVATTDRAALRRAVQLSFSDFEDAVIHEAARGGNADAIVTRNPDDFRNSAIPVYTPEQFLSLIHGTEPA